MAIKKEIALKVMEADPNVVGKKIVAIDIDTKKNLGLSHGDCIVVKGKRETVAQVWPARPMDEGSGIIRMDSFTRKNAGVNIGDMITVRVAELEEGKKVTFAPTQSLKFNGSGYTRLLKKQYLGKPMMPGEEIMFSIFGSPIVLIVQKTNPKGMILIDEACEIEVLETPTSPETGILTKASYEDIGGLGRQVEKVRELIERPLKHPELFRTLCVEPPKGILLHGPPGTGKTLLAKAVSCEANAHFVVINGPEIMSKYVGGAEERLRAKFKEAQENAPAIIFIDEIDAIAPVREEVSGDVEKRVVAQLLGLMDGLEARGELIVIGATNRPNSVDPALRRPGRFDREIEIGVPDKNGRIEILQILTRNVPMEKDVNVNLLAEITHGFVGADLSALVKEAGMQAIKRYLPGIDEAKETVEPAVLENLKLEELDFINALKEVRPSALREVFIEVPNVKWDDVGALDDIKNELKKAVEWPLKYAKELENLGIKPLKGVLLHGPPGTGKTMLAKAIARESESNFISVKGPELFSQWLGESERAIRKVFQKARQTSPCIIFFDELDAIATNRGQVEDSGASMRVVNQLLTELDGLTTSSGVVFIAATNRLNAIDHALLRPGRIDKILYTPLPNKTGRYDILCKVTSKMKLCADVNIENWSEITEGFSGASLSALVQEAGLIALERSGMKAKEITNDDFSKAYEKIAEKTEQTKEQEPEKEYNYIR